MRDNKMGIFKENVNEKYFNRHSETKKIMTPFLSGFSINYADEQHVSNTIISFFILEPEDYIKETFGFEKELAVFYSAYDHMEPRAMQAISHLMDVYPLKNRVDNLNYILISADQEVDAWLKRYFFGNENNNIVIPFNSAELLSSREAWFVRNRMREHCYAADLFGYTLPLNDDLYFFGRQQMLSRYIDSIRRGENRGVFGLRKTGKTSFLNKIIRTINDQKIGYSLFYDCKLPEYRNMHWKEFLSEICDDVIKKTDIDEPILFHDNPSKRFRIIMQTILEQRKRLILIFDEIEFISMRAIQDQHWKKEYFDFWQTLWSVQSQYRCFVFIVAGVNPSTIEIDKIDGVQNPLFGIVQAEYLQGLSTEELKLMCKTLGKRMGLKFDYSAIAYLEKQYGGHPMLTRLACSWLNTDFEETTRPINIGSTTIQKCQDQIELALVYYFKHVVSEIKDFYPDEYEMFELLASGQIQDFLELSTIAEFVHHLYSYGLVEKNETGIPTIKMPVAARYVAIELAQREGRKSTYKLVEQDKRQGRVHQFCTSIVRDMRLLEKAIAGNRKPSLFGVNSFAEADSFVSINEVKTQKDFDSFINTCNRCFVETIENYGIEIREKDYFWKTIKIEYPVLAKSLQKIKVYRHNADHLFLNLKTIDSLQEFLEEDLPNDIPKNEHYYCLQQRVLEELLTNIQIELNSLN